jgi:hypothetical protein
MPLRRIQLHCPSAICRHRQQFLDSLDNNLRLSQDNRINPKAT